MTSTARLEKAMRFLPTSLGQSTLGDSYCPGRVWPPDIAMPGTLTQELRPSAPDDILDIISCQLNEPVWIFLIHDYCTRHLQVSPACSYPAQFKLARLWAKLLSLLFMTIKFGVIYYATPVARILLIIILLLETFNKRCVKCLGMCFLWNARNRHQHQHHHGTLTASKCKFLRIHSF